MIVIQILGWANGQECPHAKEFVETFDHEADGGRGYGTFTPDVVKAMKFVDKGAAYAFWKRTPAIKPIREDGKPNRPLTAASVVFAPEEDFRSCERQ